MAKMEHCLFIALLCCSLFLYTNSQSYQDLYALHQTLFSNYSRTMRPLLNQSQQISLSPFFQIVSIVELDEVQQKITVNGLLGLQWTDELLTWNPRDYNGIDRITPESPTIWKPRLVTINTMTDRDLFEEDFSPVNVDYDGRVSWFPGGLFPVLCLFDLRKFPFDEHHCKITMSPMYMNASDMLFDMTEAMVTYGVFVPSGEWDLVNASISNELLVTGPNASYQGLNINLNVKRKATFFTINIFLPVMFLSALNVVSFVIPEDEGEKIGFSITVLLSMAVYMGTVSDRLPPNSENMPYVTYYVFLLFTISVLCCLVTILIIWLNNKEEEMEKRQRRQAKLKSVSGNLRAANVLKHLRGSTNLPKIHPLPSKCVNTSADDVIESFAGKAFPGPNKEADDASACNSNNVLLKAPKAGMKDDDNESCSKAVEINRYRNLAQKLNFYSVIVSSLASVVLTVTILILITT